MSDRETRLHDLSYAEIGVLMNELKVERDRWKRVADLFHDAVFVDASGAMNAAPADLKVAFQAWVDANASEPGEVSR